MAGQLTQYGAGQFLNAVLSRTAIIPDTFYLAFIKDIPPTPYVSGAELDEPTSGSYVRAVVPNDASTFSNAGSSNISTLQVPISFITATGDWGTMRYWALLDASIAGNPYFVGQLESPQSVLNGDTAVVSSGDLSCELGPFFATWEV